MRHDEVEDVLRRVTEWASARADIRAVALVGSRARGRARDDSDIDVVLLVDDPERYRDHDDWVAELGAGDLLRRRRWGVITEHRLAAGTSIEVDLGIGPVSWAATDAVDSGTSAVVRNGMRILHDPDGLLEALQAEVAR